MEDEKIFDRVEKKYLITSAQKSTLLKAVKKHMEKDSYFKSCIYNIYFDTDNYDLIIQSIDHPLFKEKLRARSYDGYDKVFFEIKTKLLRHAIAAGAIDEDDEIARDNNLGYKRRVLVTLKDYDKFVQGKATMQALASCKIEEKSDLQIAKEIDYFIEHFSLKPKILLYYDRESYVDKNDLRITFDENLKYRIKTLKFLKKSNDQVFFENEKNIIMEIKAQSAMPLWLVKALSAEHIYPERFSKIGKIYEKLRKEQYV